MISYYASLKDKESLLFRVKPKAKVFLESTIDLISNNKAISYGIYFQAESYLKDFSYSEEQRSIDIHTSILKGNILNSTYVWSVHLPLIDLLELIKNSSGKIATIRESFVSLCLSGLSLFNDTPFNSNPTNCFESFYSWECLSLYRISWFKKYFSNLNWTFRNISSWWNHRVFWMLIYNLFAEIESLPIVEYLQAKNSKLEERIFDWDKIDNFLDSHIPIKNRYGYHYDYSFIFTEGVFNKNSIEKYLSISFNELTSVDSLSIPKNWISKLNISFVDKLKLNLDFLFDKEESEEKIKLITLLKQNMIEYEHILKQVS